MVLPIAPPGGFEPSPPVRRAGAAESSFRDALTGLVRPTTEAAHVAIASLAAVGRADPDREPPNRKARRQAKQLLDALQAMQRDLLRSGASAASLSRIVQLAEDLAPGHERADAELADICAGIVLRARIEAAKLRQRGPARRHEVAQSTLTEPDERII